MKFLYNTLKLCLILSLSFNAFAENVQRIQKSIPSPIDGWVVTDSFMQKAAEDKKKVGLLEQKTQTLEQQSVLQIQKSESQDRQIDLAKQESKFFQENYQKEQKKLEQSERGRFWSNMGHFALGVVMTGLAAKAAIESSR